jgi:hypothetical protein
MNGDYTITANFGFDMTYIDDVPDTSQPPTSGAPAYCAPMAMINILCYWDVVMGHANAQNVTAGLPAKTAADYLGYFMDTNNNGSPARANGGSLGTLDVDIAPGTWEFVRWDAGNLFLTPPPVLPAGKLGYNWAVTQNCTTDYGLSLAIYKTEIDAGRPLVVSFDFWNPVFRINFTDPQSGETISVFNWGDYKSYSEDPEEYWYDDIGHAVTGVGYKLNWDPDGSGSLPLGDYVIVYDNWPNTPKNIAIPWLNWKCLFAVDPAGVPPAKHDLTISSDLFGSVTTPGEGTFTCDAGAVVNLVATPFAECVFVNWTGDVGNIANVNAASTTITMNGDYTITANFLFTPVVPP